MSEILNSSVVCAKPLSRVDLTASPMQLSSSVAAMPIDADGPIILAAGRARHRHPPFVLTTYFQAHRGPHFASCHQIGRGSRANASAVRHPISKDSLRSFPLLRG